VPLVGLLVYVLFSLVGFMNIPWTISAELFPAEIRGPGHSICYAIGSFSVFVGVYLYRDLLDLIGGPAYLQWFFAFSSFLGFLFGLFILPETFQKELWEIEEYFTKKRRRRRSENVDVNDGQ
jgi:SP family facilitated glucose transporter-like MFS transporter 8